MSVESEREATILGATICTGRRPLILSTSVLSIEAIHFFVHSLHEVAELQSLIGVNSCKENANNFANAYCAKTGVTWHLKVGIRLHLADNKAVRDYVIQSPGHCTVSF